MEFNSSKFECLRYGKNKELIESTSYTTLDKKIIDVNNMQQTKKVKGSKREKQTSGHGHG